VDLRIVAVGSLGDGGIDVEVEEYLERADSYVPAEVVEVSSGSGDPERRMRSEAQSLRAAAPDGGTWVAVDRSGRSISSRTFADWIDDQMVGGVRYVSFFVGGAHGLDPEFRESECHWTLSLSPFTLPHGLARLVLAEQLYRAMTIIRGEPYHK